MPEEIMSTESVALEALVPALQKLELGREQTVLSTIDSATGIAIMAKDKKTSVRAVELLGNYAGLKRTEETYGSETLKTQKIASSKICGIALVLSDPDVDNAAIDALGKRLGVPMLGDGKEHQEALVDLAVVALHSGAAQKEKAIAALSEYAHRKRESRGGVVGTNAFPETQATAAQLIGIIGTD